MQALGEYICGVCGAAFVCGIVSSMMPKGAAKEVLKLVGGLFLVFTVIRPVADISLPELAEIGRSLQQEAKDAASAGEEMALQSAEDRIKAELEAYILDKAQELRISVTVELALEDGSLMPSTVHLTGNASPYAKAQMEQYLQEELGFSEEEIIWTGRK